MRSKTMGSTKTKYLRFYDKTNTWSADAKFDEEQHKMSGIEKKEAMQGYWDLAGQSSRQVFLWQEIVV
jgi:hypothetical protein